MADGPGGSWYRAAKFKSKQECMDFIAYIKMMLAQRSNVDDDLVTISFGNPQGDKLVACMGFPDEASKTFAEMLFEGMPEVVLTTQDLEFARRAIVEMRRNQGISDPHATEYARQRLVEMARPLMSLSLSSGLTKLKKNSLVGRM